MPFKRHPDPISRKYEPLRPGGRETDAYDAYDAHATHSLLRANDSGRFIGCIRPILPNPQDPVAPFPFEKTCAATFDRNLIDPKKIDRTKVAEVSRLAVVSAYRRRKGEKDSEGTISKEDFGSPERRRPEAPQANATLSRKRERGIGPARLLRHASESARRW